MMTTKKATIEDLGGLEEYKFSLKMILLTGLLLFLPEGILKTAYLTAARESYGTFIAIVFVFSITVAFMKAFMNIKRSRDAEPELRLDEINK